MVFFVEADHTYVTNELAKTFDLPTDTVLVVFDPAEDKKNTRYIAQVRRD